MPWISSERQRAFKMATKASVREQGSTRKSKNFRWSLTYDILRFGVRKMSVAIDCLRISEDLRYWVRECALDSDGH